MMTSISVPRGDFAAFPTSPPASSTTQAKEWQLARQLHRPSVARQRAETASAVAPETCVMDIVYGMAQELGKEMGCVSIDGFAEEVTGLAQ